MAAQRKPLHAFNGLKNLLTNSATRLGSFLAPGFGMTRRASRAGAAPAAFLCSVRFQIRPARPLRRLAWRNPRPVGFSAKRAVGVRLQPVSERKCNGKKIYKRAWAFSSFCSSTSQKAHTGVSLTLRLFWGSFCWCRGAAVFWVAARRTGRGRTQALVCRSPAGRVAGLTKCLEGTALSKRGLRTGA
jgi:hypothetical protein